MACCIARGSIHVVLSLALARVIAVAGADAGQECTRVASFLTLGDWGWDPWIHGNVRSQACQQEIANLMDKTMRKLGDVKFIVNVGDSFYPAGVNNKTDWQWDFKWRKVYTQLLRSVPWYSVYGNHDHLEEGCACADDPRKVELCAQFNNDLNNLDYFYLPDFSWYRVHPELDLEVIALDLTYQMWVNNTCPWTSCKEKCMENQRARGKDALDLFEERMNKTNASNIVVFTHYPTDYFWGHQKVLNQLSDMSNATGRNLVFFGGHRHNTDNTSVTSIAPSSSWLVGGGGGWGCDGSEQGFTVTELMSDGTMKTYPVLAQWDVCCRDAWWP